MADQVTQLPVYAYEKVKQDSDESFDKKLDDSSIDDAQRAKEMEEFEERLQNDDAADSEYFVQEAYEVAVKVLTTHDEPELNPLTFRTLFLGLGLGRSWLDCSLPISITFLSSPLSLSFLGFRSFYYHIMLFQLRLSILELISRYSKRIFPPLLFSTSYLRAYCIAIISLHSISL